MVILLVVALHRLLCFVLLCRHHAAKELFFLANSTPPEDKRGRIRDVDSLYFLVGNLRSASRLHRVARRQSTTDSQTSATDPLMFWRNVGHLTLTLNSTIYVIAVNVFSSDSHTCFLEELSCWSQQSFSFQRIKATFWNYHSLECCT